MDKAYLNEYYYLERYHWWFRAREAILKSYLKASFNHSSSLNILNLGAATGKSSQMLENFGSVISVEYDEDICNFLQNDLGLEAFNVSAKNLPFEGDQFDLVCAFDVIEHIDDEEPALQEIQRVLKPDGNMAVTVPAFMSLWSRHDDVNHHYRRYTKTTLRNTTQKFFKEKYCSYYNCLLFPMIAFQRVLAKLIPFDFKKEGAGSDFSLKLPSFFEKSLFWLFQSERHLLKYHIPLPVGVSILYEGSPKK